MKLLRDILYGVSLKEVFGQTDLAVEWITFDSRDAKVNSLFVAIAGTNVDGHFFIDKAIGMGATCILCERMPNELQKGISYLRVDSCTKSLGLIASNYYDNPSSKLKLVGITGTNGKTTTATLLADLFTKMKYNVGLISTIRYKINKEQFEATHTTPDILTLNRLLSKMIDEGCEFCFMEVSSHAVVQGRVEGLTFAGGVFTNISHDHLDYHHTFDAYIKAKKTFFDQLPSNAFALVNNDDKRGMVMLQNTKAKKASYSLKALSDFRAKILENNLTGLVLNIDQEEIHSLLIGEFNAYNLMAVYGTAILLGEERKDVLVAISILTAVEGRFEYVDNRSSGIVGIVDYAHTPDALQNVLATINQLRTRNEKLITIIGCGGDRDKAKRPIMAFVAASQSDLVLLTSDNPRSEDPNSIIQDMEKGVEVSQRKKVISIVNRKEAIRTACKMAERGDIILLAGKGHESYQEISGVKHPFDDKSVLGEALKQMIDF